MTGPGPATRSEHHYDTIVVGNGALGLALGYELARRRQRVAVVGPRQRETGASVAAGAMNGCFGEVTRDLLSSPHGRAKLEVDIEASRLWDSWSEEIADAAGVPVGALRQKTGTTVLLNAIGTNAIDSANFAAIQAALEEYGTRYSVLEEQEIPWISPQESSRSFRALHLPDEHSVITPAYLSAVETALSGRGGALVDGSVTKIDAAGPGAATASLADGTRMSADAIVLAAGAHSCELLRQALPDVAGSVPPMVSGYGVSVLVRDVQTAPLREVIRTPNRSFSCGLHVVPRPDCIYLGATNIMRNRPQTLPTISDLHFLLDCAMKQLRTDLHGGRILRLQVGNRPIPVDGFPLIGALPDSSLWLMTGTYRDGFHQSPVIAAQLAEAIAGGGQATTPAAFVPVRPPIQAATRAQVVTAAVEHTLAGGFEGDWRIPVKWSNRINADLTAKYAAAAERLHPKFTPPPDVFAFSLENPWLSERLNNYYAAYS